MDNKIKIKEFEKHMRTPRKWDNIHNESKASILVLSFIGFLARPSGIPSDVLKDAVEAFNSNRGQYEWEYDAVEKAIKKYLTN